MISSPRISSCVKRGKPTAASSILAAVAKKKKKCIRIFNRDSIAARRSSWAAAMVWELICGHSDAFWLNSGPGIRSSPERMSRNNLHALWKFSDLQIDISLSGVQGRSCFSIPLGSLASPSAARADEGGLVLKRYHRHSSRRTKPSWTSSPGACVGTPTDDSNLRTRSIIHLSRTSP